ncbi:glycosyltransferase [Psychrobacter urativorans]|uniref:glycosyltransferase n=1 Tax=Psychrobacter urativorans TaxID=45610 RepID=UPI0019199671|nr:glycosyltransferase [Psychrobacter urativorans]
MKKIYITSRHLGHGGIEKIICDLSNLFIEMNYDVEILCTYFYKEPVYYLDNKVKITYLTDQLPRKTASLKKSLTNLNLISFLSDACIRATDFYLHSKLIINSIKDIENSIIISTRNEHTTIISKHSKDSNKLIAQLHCDHTQFRGYSKDIRDKYGKMDYLLLLTEELKSEVESILIGSNQKTKCLTVPNFIANKEFIKDTKRKNQVISVGRLSPEKGFDRLLFIWKEFLDNNENYILKIVGDGQEKERLIQLAKSLNISDSVVFTGYLSNDETVNEIRKSKVYVMTSMHEALPMVLLEAINQGTPIVAYDVRVGPRSIIKDGYNGFLVKENDIKSFVEKLEILSKEDKVYNSMSRNAIVSSELYSVEKIKRIWSDILE